MGAQLIPGGALHAEHQLVLPSEADAGGAVALVRAAAASSSLTSRHSGASVELGAGAWLLPIRELRGIASALEGHQLQLKAISSANRRTLVAARALGLEAHYCDPPGLDRAAASDGAPESAQAGPAFSVHQGTLRSGDHLQVDGSVLVLGDVNPGARISASGHVLVWGKLRGVAHAGLKGDLNAKIVALHFRPLQLRIAGAVARGPDGLPPGGLAEEARLVNGAIQIDPASPSWPLCS